VTCLFVNGSQSWYLVNITKPAAQQIDTIKKKNGKTTQTVLREMNWNLFLDFQTMLK
jgi:hypothetical protein